MEEAEATTVTKTDDKQRPNSFYDVNSLQTLGGCATAIFIAGGLIRYFHFDITHKTELWNEKNWIFYGFILLASFILALVRVFTPGESLLTLQNKNPESELEYKKDAGSSNISYYFQRFLIIIRNAMLVLLNTFMIISATVGLSAVSGDSWLPSSSDNIALKQAANTAQKQDSLIDIARPIIADSLEKEGFNYLVEGKFKDAKSSFTRLEEVYPSYHSAFEIKQLLRRNESQLDSADTQKAIIDTILNNKGTKTYNHKMPDASKAALKAAYQIK